MLVERPLLLLASWWSDLFCCCWPCCYGEDIACVPGGLLLLLVGGLLPALCVAAASRADISAVYGLRKSNLSIIPGTRYQVYQYKGSAWVPASPAPLLRIGIKLVLRSISPSFPKHEIGLDIPIIISVSTISSKGSH